MSRPSQRAWTLAELDALPVRVTLPTAASILGMGVKKLRTLFNENGDRTAKVRVGDREVAVEALRLGRQLWVVTESLRRVFDARGP